MILVILRNGSLCILVFVWFLFSNAEIVSEDFLYDLEKLLNKSILSTNQPKDIKEIVNVTCILDKYGLGYIGTKNITYDGLPCEKWSKNTMLYPRYLMANRSLSDNYCRNPDNDSIGPWCFVYDYGLLRIKSCDIPSCQSKITLPLIKTDIGITLLLKRECPIGFIKEIVKRQFTTETYCKVEQRFLHQLPFGPYSLKFINPHENFVCPEGFKMETGYSSRKEGYCTRTNSSSDLIEFPTYLTPKPDELIFVALKLGSNSICPKMSGKTYVINRKEKIRQISDSFSISSHEVTTCHYFSKLAKNPISECLEKPIDQNPKLAILVREKSCPKNWTARSLMLEWESMMTTSEPFSKFWVDGCIPNKDIQNYPDGDYCLISLTNSKGSRFYCPKEFIDVDIKIDGKIDIKFCCTQSHKSGNSNDNVYNFFNVSSIFIINSAGKCEKSEKKDIIVKQYTLNLFSFEKMDCTNCDLFEAFAMKKSIFMSTNQFTVCSYAKATNGFAYETLNSQCPPNMNYGYIHFFTKNGLTSQSLDVMASLCTIASYPGNITFPEGRYCIYKLGSHCPPGFQTLELKQGAYFYKYKDSGGDVTNYEMDNYCCKFGPRNISFENATLPYVTKDFQFGLPYPDSSFRCVHGLATHTATEDYHMCHYYPIPDKSSRHSIAFASDKCDYRTDEYRGFYRQTYSSVTINPYCKFYVNDRPPPGNYCASFSKTCPPKYFDYITYHPLMQHVICCRKPVQNDTTEKEYTTIRWVNDLKSFSLLSYKKECPIFERYNYGKETKKSDYSYTASEISQDYQKNLSDIGIDVTRTLTGYSVSMSTCDYKHDLYNKSINWPHGQYAFPKPLTGCPSSFKSGEFSHSMETSNPSFAHSDTIHLDGDYMKGGTTIKWGFCVRKDDNVTENLDLPYGRYCLMKVDSCRHGFYEGSVTFVEITALNKSMIHREGVLPTIEIKGPFITYHFCCQSGRGDIAHEPMYLPTQGGSFYLMKYGTYCQNVYGMRFSEEFICIDSENSPRFLNYTFQAPYQILGATPVTGSFIKDCDFQINLCYYELDTPVAAPSTPQPGPLVDWPTGSYVFLKPYKSPCPLGFDEGAIVINEFYQSYPRFMHSLMVGTIDENNAIYSYCKRNSPMVDKLRPAENWPSGNYCLFVESKCPPGMERPIYHGRDNRTPKNHMGAQLGGWSKLCCQKEKLSNRTALPYFPGECYSFIIPPTRDLHACPAHQNARAALVIIGFLCIYERLDESIEFPDGDYLLPAPQAPMNACATGFKLVEHRHFPLKGDDRKLNMKMLRFCQKETNGPNNATFPRGNYCVLTTNDRCPSSQFTMENILIIPFYHFEDELHKFSRYLACCQKDEKIISNIAIRKVPFALYGSSSCSYVDGIPSVWESDEETILVQPSGLERPPFNKARKTLRICKYGQINEMVLGERCKCHPNASCSMYLGDNNCQCLPGFFGDGKTVCAEITNGTDKCGDLCDKRVSVCSKSSSAGYSCICKEGYEFKGFKCIPSCKTKNCKAFSHCIINELESHCMCNPSTIEVGNGRCHGDLINTMYHLSGFDYLSQMNLSCFNKEAYDHLVMPREDSILFLFFYMDKDIFTDCNLTRNYYGFTWKQQFRSDNSLRITINTESDKSILVTKSEENKWMVDNKFLVFKTDLFTNAVVLYLNGTETPNDVSHFSLHYLGKSRAKAITGFVVGGVLSFFLIIILLFIINRKRGTPIFSKVLNTRSESNIHLITANDQIEMES